MRHRITILPADATVLGFWRMIGAFLHSLARRVSLAAGRRIDIHGTPAHGSARQQKNPSNEAQREEFRDFSIRRHALMVPFSRAEVKNSCNPCNSWPFFFSHELHEFESCA